MTIARDIQTGAVVGQVREAPLETYADSPRFALTHADIAAGYPRFVRVLTAGGWRNVPRASVRLEHVAD